MMSLQSINNMQREAAARASREEQVPLVPECESDEYENPDGAIIDRAIEALPEDGLMIALDQYNRIYHIPGKHPRQELLERLDRQHADKIYRDKRDGPPVHVGYIIAGLWLSLYEPVERPV